MQEQVGQLKPPGLSGLAAEVIQAMGDTGTQWILDLCNGIVKDCTPEDWKSCVILPIYKGKRDPMECGSYTGIKLLEHAMKVVERILEDRIQQQKEELKERSSVLALWIRKKLLIGSERSDRMGNA